MRCLLTKSDFTDVITLTTNLNFDKKIKPHVIISQELTLSDWLGHEFLMAVAEAPESYMELLNGESYTTKEGTYYFTGLRRVLSFLAMSKAVWDMNGEMTDSGAQFKNNEYSTAASGAVLSRMSKQYENDALAYWNKAEAYLNASRDKYPLWRKGDACCERPQRNRTRITAVSAEPEQYNHYNGRYTR